MGFLFYMFYETERYTEHENAFYAPLMAVAIIEKQSALKPPYRVKFCHSTKHFKTDNLFLSTNIYRMENMSTNQRYGDAVWAAILEIQRQCVEEDRSYWFTVTDVASGAGVSKPTARKYMTKLKEWGRIHRAGSKQMPIYAFVSEGVS